MKTIELTESAITLSENSEEIGEPIVLTKGGEPFALIVGVDELEWEAMSLSDSSTFQRIIKESWEDYQKNGGISSEEMRRRLGLGE